MRKYFKEFILLLIQFLMFYIFPMFKGPTDVMGMVILMLFVTLVISFIIGLFFKNKFKFFYPFIVSILFIPSIFIYYNMTALIHSIWYLVISMFGILIGIFLRFVMKIK